MNDAAPQLSRRKAEASAVLELSPAVPAGEDGSDIFGGYPTVCTAA
jgi:hypothetical protein